MLTVLETYPVDPQRRIESIGELRFHLANAAAVELSTVPLYLYAAYSIKTSGYDQWAPGISAFRTIRSVVIEEMLHLCLARNLLVAIGGDVPLYDKSIVPKFPSDMLHRQPPLSLRLAPASVELMNAVFIPLELPTRDIGPLGAVGEEEVHYDPIQYETLGQFYDAIKQGFEDLDAPGSDVDLWGDDETRLARSALQYGRAYWNDDGGGQPIVVKDLKTAKLAIDTIVEQGEGAKGDTVPIKPADPTAGLDELTHYAKFQQIAKGIDRIGDVWPVPENPTRADYADNPPLLALATLFDAAYCYVLCMLDEIYKTPTITRDTDAQGSVIANEPMKSERYHLERTFLAAMGGLLYPIAELLVRQPLDPKGKGPAHAAATFGYYAFKGASMADRKLELIGLCEDAVQGYPSLGGDDGVLQLIHRLAPTSPVYA